MKTTTKTNLRIDRTNFALRPRRPVRAFTAWRRTQANCDLKIMGDRTGGMNQSARMPYFYASFEIEIFIRTLSGAELKI
jgi:hypothetical protein